MAFKITELIQHITVLEGGFGFLVSIVIKCQVRFGVINGRRRYYLGTYTQPYTHMDVVVKEYWHKSRWNLVFENILSSRANEEVQWLRSDLTDHKPKDHKDDCLVWRCDKKDSFLIRFTYRQFIDRSCRLSNADLIWNAKCSLNIKAFLGLIN